MFKVWGLLYVCRKCGAVINAEVNGALRTYSKRYLRIAIME